MSEIFRFHSKRVDRMHRIQTVQHVAAALVLITHAWPHVGHGTLPYLEIAAGAALIIAAIVEKVRKKHLKVGIVEIAGALVLFVEGYARMRAHNKWTLLVPEYLQGLVLLLLGAFDEHVRSARYFRATDAHLVMRSRMLRWRTVPWKEIRSYRVTPKAIELVLESGKVRPLPLRDVKERDLALAWVTEQFARRGITTA